MIMIEVTRSACPHHLYESKHIKSLPRTQPFPSRLSVLTELSLLASPSPPPHSKKLFEEHKTALKETFAGQEEVEVTGGGLGEWCVSATTAEECRSSVDEGGTTCVWCTCQSVPSECVPAATAKVR